MASSSNFGSLGVPESVNTVAFYDAPGMFGPPNCPFQLMLALRVMSSNPRYPFEQIQGFKNSRGGRFLDIHSEFISEKMPAKVGAVRKLPRTCKSRLRSII